uniref:Uncharacterized protein n=1 Tax=Guillardia theta TaxID=55529 RepID=A0A7S4KU24_GUITH
MSPLGVVMGMAGGAHAVVGGGMMISSSYKHLRAVVCVSILLQSIFLLTFVDQWTPRRIVLLDVGLGLGGLLRIVLHHLERRKGEMKEQPNAAPRSNKETEETNIERALIMWSVCSWSSVLYISPAIYAMLRQGGGRTQVEMIVTSLGLNLVWVSMVVQILLPASVSPRHQRMVQWTHYFGGYLGAYGHYYKAHDWILAWGPLLVGMLLFSDRSPLVKVCYGDGAEGSRKWDGRRWREFAVEIGYALLPHEQQKALPLRRDNPSTVRPLPSAFLQ